MGFGAPVPGKAPCIAPPAAFSRYKDASSLIARPLLFLFPSHTGHPPRSCSGLRPPSFTDHRRSSVAVSRLRMRHRHPRSRVTTGLWSPDRSSLALLGHCPSPSKPSSEQQPRALSDTLSHSLKSCSLSLHFWLLLSPIGHGSCLRRAEGLLALISAALDSRTLTSLRQPSFHHCSVDLGSCCGIGWGLSAGADRRGEANAGQEHGCYTTNGENASPLITTPGPSNKYAWTSRSDKDRFWVGIWWHGTWGAERGEQRWWAEASQWGP